MRKQVFLQVKEVRRLLTLTIIFGGLGTMATIAQMVFLSKVVNQIFLLHESRQQVEWLLLWLLGAIIVRAGLVWGREVTALQSSLRVKAALRERLFTHVLQLGPAYCKGERTGELVTTAGEGIERLDAYVSRYLPQMILSILVPFLIAAYIFPLDWGSSVLLLVTAPIIPLLMILIGSYAEARIKVQWTALSRMSAYFLDVVQGLATLKLFGLSGSQHERIARVSNGFRERTMKVMRIAFLSGMVLELMTALAIGLVAVTLGVRLLNTSIAFESAFLVLLLAPEFYRPLRELGIYRHAGMEGKAAAARIFEILDIPLPVEPVHSSGSSARQPGGELTIELSDVTYTYPGNDRPALSSINLVLPAQTCTALVGQSGAGKSTLANLLLRFMEAQSGVITVNGIPLTELPVETWRSLIALVPQRPYLFNESIRANIRMARPTASDAEVAQAAELAGAVAFIEQLPQGYDTRIGERGARLSAGQVQRIAIARAFLKDAPLLILDEPTSSLDPESELLIRHALEQLMRDRTVLVIAHRYNTIAHAQRIVVLQDGRLVEAGSQSQLLQSNGAYAHLMGSYREGEIAV